VLERSRIVWLATCLVGVAACGNAEPTAPASQAAKPAPAAVALEVVRFELRDAKGELNPGGNHYARGRIPWYLELRGAEPKGGKFTVGLKTKISNAEGKVMFEAPSYNPVEVEAHAEATTKTTFGFDNTAHIPQLGNYELELMLRDEVSGRETSMREMIVIQ